MQLTQNKSVSLPDYMTRLNKEAVEVVDLTCSFMLVTLLNNTEDKEFRKLLALDQPTTIQEIKNRAEKYIQLE